MTPLFGPMSATGGGVGFGYRYCVSGMKGATGWPDRVYSQ